MTAWTLYGAPGSGAVAVEAALILAGQAYDVVDAITWDPAEAASGDRVLSANPMRQVPALVLPSGEVLTESAAILLWLVEQFPEAGLGPLPGEAGRAQLLRWMSFVSASIYSLYWVKDDPARLAPDPAAQGPLVDLVHARITDCWRRMDGELDPAPYLLGDRLSVLDLYVAVVSRFRPRRQAFYAAAPGMADAIRRVDADPRFTDLWAERYPFEPGWDA